MTMRDPLRVEPVSGLGDEAWSVTGLPVDCVNVALTLAWPDGCDLILSGINPGPNMGFDITYSGTVAGAMEGCINSVRSVAVSIAVFTHGAPIHYQTAEAWLAEALPWLSSVPLEPLTYLNVNIPNIAFPELRGTQITTMGNRVYEDRVEERADPWGRPYFWQGGTAMVDATIEGTDHWATSQGFVSVTPLRLNWTDHQQIETLTEGLPHFQRLPG
jgi:5'-nucleotidase